MTIYSNGNAIKWTNPWIKHNHLCILAGHNLFSNEQDNVEISYRIKKGAAYEEGYLLPRSSIKVVEGMEFMVKVKNKE